MPAFTLRWANRGTSTQHWMVQNFDDFTLLPNYVRSVAININNNYTYMMAVDTPGPRFSAASLTYTAATNLWTLNSMTPNEWQLAQGNGIVTVRCLLSDDGAQQADVPSYAAADPEPGED